MRSYRSVTANGGEILGSLAVPPGTTDYGPFLTQVMAKKPDYVTCIVNGMMLINCMKQAYAMGMKDKMKFVTFHVNIEEVNGCGPEVIQDVLLVTDYFWNMPERQEQGLRREISEEIRLELKTPFHAPFPALCERHPVGGCGEEEQEPWIRRPSLRRLLGFKDGLR